MRLFSSASSSVAGCLLMLALGEQVHSEECGAAAIGSSATQAYLRAVRQKRRIFCCFSLEIRLSCHAARKYAWIRRVVLLHLLPMPRMNNVGAVIRTSLGDCEYGTGCSWAATAVPPYGTATAPPGPAARDTSLSVGGAGWSGESWSSTTSVVPANAGGRASVQTQGGLFMPFLPRWGAGRSAGERSRPLCRNRDSDSA